MSIRLTCLSALALLLLPLPARAASPQGVKDDLPAPPEGKAWKLVWHDEFDGPKLDETKWDVPEGRRRDGWWSRRATSLDGKGHLLMSTLKEDGKYLDACVRTRGKYEHAYGYYVARIQLQEQPGHWSAFWMFNTSVNRVGNQGRDGTEIDIMEKPWLDDRVQQTLHWDGYGRAHKSEGKVVKVPGVMKGFHTFALWWKPDEYIFYVDGKATWHTKAGGVCQVPLYIKLSDEIGKWGGNIARAKLPDRFVVDYVRVYDVVDK
jgi:beta-glucanase (GH16 family)